MRYDNSAGAPGKDPLVKADKAFGEWNHFRIIMAGSRVWVWLNDQQTVAGANMENYYDRKLPVPPKGPLQLQTHGGEIRWRNLYVREIGPDESNKLLRGNDPAGFQSVFDGKDFDGWGGPIDNYQIKEGSIMCRPGKGGTIYTTAEYSDFIARLEFRLPPGGNNGLAIRTRGQAILRMMGCARARFWMIIMRKRPAIRSIRARRMVRRMAWSPPSEVISTPSANGITRKSPLKVPP